MAVGSNLSYNNQKALQKLILEKLGFGSGVMDRSGKLCEKSGAPSDGAAGDNPTGTGDFCYDSSNDDVYVCTAYSADASSTVWTKIT